MLLNDSKQKLFLDSRPFSTVLRNVEKHNPDTQRHATDDTKHLKHGCENPKRRLTDAMQEIRSIVVPSAG